MVGLHHLDVSSGSLSTPNDRWILYILYIYIHLYKEKAASIRWHLLCGFGGFGVMKE